MRVFLEVVSGWTLEEFKEHDKKLDFLEGTVEIGTLKILLLRVQKEAISMLLVTEGREILIK